MSDQSSYRNEKSHQQISRGVPLNIITGICFCYLTELLLWISWSPYIHQVLGQKQTWIKRHGVCGSHTLKEAEDADGLKRAWAPEWQENLSLEPAQALFAYPIFTEQGKHNPSELTDRTLSPGAADSHFSFPWDVSLWAKGRLYFH